MRQAVIVRHGAPDVIQIREAPDPHAGAGEVRIAVAAAGVNFADVMARLGLYPEAPKPPVVVGYEVSGTVDEVGPGVTTLRVGDRVLALTRFGGYSTAVVVPEAFAFPLAARPPAYTLTDIQAAAVAVNYLTAMIALYRLANVAAGEVVLIHGAGGGVGIAATQLAKLKGARVIGTASTAKIDAIRALGVDDPIDHRQKDVAAEVRRLTSNRGADVVLDSLGGQSFGTSYGLLAPLGRLVLLGASRVAPGERRSLLSVAKTVFTMPAFRPLRLMNENRSVMGLNLGRLWDEVGPLRAAMHTLLEDFAAGKLQPVIAKVFPLEEAAEAHRYLQSRSNIGKVVLSTR